MIRLILLFSIALTSIFQANEGSHLITLISPENNIITSKPLILIKGHTQNIEHLTLNGAPIELFSNGKFFQKAALTNPGKYHAFKLEGFTSDGQKTSQSFKVFLREKTSPTHTLSLLSPKKSSDQVITVEGKGKNLKDVYVNGVKAPLIQNTYKIKVALSNLDSPQDIIVTAKTNNNIFISQKKTVLFTPPQPKQKKQLTSTEQLILSHLVNEYEKLQWKKQTWDISLSTATRYIDPLLLIKLKDNLVVMEHKESYLVALPLYQINYSISILSDAIIDAIKHDFNKKKEVTILWFNARNTIWEMYYNYPHSNGNTAYLWLLNDKELQPKNLSKKDKKIINIFLSAPFLY